MREIEREERRLEPVFFSFFHVKSSCDVRRQTKIKLAEFFFLMPEMQKPMSVLKQSWTEKCQI